MITISLGRAAVTAVVALAPATALAQTVQPGGPAEQAAEVGEVVVTARKRQEVLIDVPQSVTVVGGAALERQQATSFQDYLNLVPGLQLNQDTPGEGRLVLRGINTGGVASTVAVYVDETPFGSSSGLVNGGVLAGDFDAFDVARIEVLRGPQGTLYGASSLGGVLKFVTNAPRTDRVVVRGRTTVESVADGDLSSSAAGVLNVPLSDTLAVRGSAYVRETGGFIDSIGTAGSDVEEDINGSRSTGGRLTALYRPDARISVRAAAVLQDFETDAASIVESDPETLETLYGRPSQSQYVPSFTEVNYRVYSMTADVDLGFAGLTSATSYGTLDQTYRSDLTPLLSPVLEPLIGPNEFLQDQQTDQRKFTQEVRLTSNADQGFEWLVGGYYTRERGAIIQDFSAVAPGTLTPIEGLPVLGELEQKSVYEEYAAFANATVRLGERFDVTVGGRYSSNEQRARQRADGVLAGGAAVFPPAESSEEVFTYSVAPKFEVGEHASFYARVAKGFRPGGPNVLPPAAPPGTPLTYDSDTLISYEAGFKGETPDRRYAIDLAVFHLDWKDIQLFAQVNNVGLNVNGSSAESNGFEFTATARPTPGLSLSVNGAYTDAELTGDTDPIVGGLAGDRLPFTPEFSVSLVGDYEWPLSPDVTAYVGGSVRSLSEQSGDFDFSYRSATGRQRVVPAYEVVDLRAGLIFGRLSLEAFVKNLGDSDGRTSTSTLGSFPEGALGTGVIRPRTIGLSLGAEF